MSMQMTPFIMLDGKAEAAIRFYEEALQAKVVFKQTFGDAPPQSWNRPLTEEERKRIAHCVIKAGDTELFVADADAGEYDQPGSQVSICISVDKADTARQTYESLQQGGQIVRPLAAIYFSPAYGIVKDKFDVVFQIFTKRS
nr:VOC family protein [Paenibacillus pinihumi]